MPKRGFLAPITSIKKNVCTILKAVVGFEVTRITKRSQSDNRDICRGGCKLGCYFGVPQKIPRIRINV